MRKRGGRDLSEIFECVSTTREVNYAKYFALAGLNLEFTSSEGRGAYLGVDTHTE